MKKTITANISGSVFHIEEDAYEQLNSYLNSIRTKFHRSPDADEIIADIEGRIAELFLENKRGASKIVTTGDVSQVIQIMGSPEDYVEDEANTGQQPYNERSKERGTRKLYRDPDDRWLGGVMSGIAAYFDTSVFTLRLLLIFSFFLGLPIIAYIIAWIIIPKATTNAEKLQMRGEAVTVENIKRMFEEGVDSIERGAKKFASKAEDLGKEVHSGKPGNGVDRFFSFLGDTLQYLFKSLGKVLGILLILIGSVILGGILVMVFGNVNFIWNEMNLVQGGDINQIAGMLFLNNSQTTWIAVAGITAILIPAIWFFAAGIRVLNRKKHSGRWSLLFIPIWIFALITTAAIAGQVGLDFRKKTQIRSEMPIVQPAGEVITILADTPVHFYGEYHGDTPNRTKIDGEVVYMDHVTVKVEQSPDTLYHLWTTKSAKGRNSKAAKRRAKNISHTHYNDAYTLRFSPYFTVPIEDRYRDQRINFVLQVPIGKAVFFDESSIDVIYDIDNVFNEYDPYMMGQIWTMTKQGLSNALTPEEVPNAIPHSIDQEEMYEKPNVRSPDPGPMVYTPEKHIIKKINIPTLFNKIRYVQNTR